ncbi:MAG: conserved rane protein of unknown function [Candidatus Eremiobacteraeota bacterium]|nr:conserved rane protein of unknown function [Candidatus Eremiobacteraeota bacterium]
MIAEAPGPNINLSRSQTIRLVVVGILVVLALLRVVPDFVRVAYPLQLFRYQTDGNGIVSSVAPRPSPTPRGAARSGVARATANLVSFARRGRGKASVKPSPAPDLGDELLRGDRVRIDRIRPFDRKPGLAGRGYTYENPIRFLPVERAGEERVLRLVARPESVTIRSTDMLRIVLCIIAVALGAMLFLIKPSIATAAFFVFSLAAVEAPVTYLDTIIPNPWRPIPEWIHDTLRGAVRPALLLFALCLIDGDADAPRERLFAWFAAALAIGLGTLNAYAQWSMNYAALPAEQLDRILRGTWHTIDVMIGIALLVAFVRARTNDRHRISWIAAAFLFAGAARLASDTFYPGRITGWQNSLLVSATIVPIATIWIAVIRHQFFNVDFVVSRAVVYAALTAGVFGVISVFEEVGTYLFYQNADFAYIVFSAITLGLGMITGRLVKVLSQLVDRFIFRDRREQRQALEFIAGYILDAETVEDVYRALLQDAPHALKLSFGGILGRQPDGSYVLAQQNNWPEDFSIRLDPNDEITRAITRTRGALSFSGKDTRLIQRSFPNERLTFAAPIFFDRTVSGIVVYGHNVSGLDLDPEEREHLVRVVAHASIALNTIELNRYRNANATAPLPAPEPAPLPSPEPA